MVVEQQWQFPVGHLLKETLLSHKPKANIRYRDFLQNWHLQTTETLCLIFFSSTPKIHAKCEDNHSGYHTLVTVSN